MKFWPLVLLILSFAGCGERFTFQYPNGGKAQNSIEATHGWVPAWLPDEAIDIHLQYDLDTNERWLRFSLTLGKRSHFLSDFSPLSDEDAKQSFARHPSGVNWWFEGLVQSEPANDNALNAHFYIDRHHTSEKTSLAVDRISEKIYVYITQVRNP